VSFFLSDWLRFWSAVVGRSLYGPSLTTPPFAVSPRPSGLWSCAHRPHVRPSTLQAARGRCGLIRFVCLHPPGPCFFVGQGTWAFSWSKGGTVIEGGWTCVRSFAMPLFFCRRRGGECARRGLEGRAGGFFGGRVRAAVGRRRHRPAPAKLVPAAVQKRGGPALSHLGPVTHASDRSLPMC